MVVQALDPCTYWRAWHNFLLSLSLHTQYFNTKKKLTYTITTEARAPLHNAGASSFATSIKQVNMTTEVARVIGLNVSTLKSPEGTPQRESAMV